MPYACTQRDAAFPNRCLKNRTSWGTPLQVTLVERKSPPDSRPADNGTEFAAYAQMGLPVYFADPAGQGTSGGGKGPTHERRLNNRPRKTLGYLTPNEVLFGIPPTPVAIRT